MILILLGTQDKPFTRILEAVDKLIDEKKIQEEVIVQKGHTKYTSKNMKMFDLISKDEYLKYVEEARFIISHAGVGTIFDCLSKNKKIIVVPRLSKYKEHTNDHQLEITKEFGKQGYVIALEDIKKLYDAIKQIETFKPKKYISNTKNIINYIENFIEENKKV